MNLSGSTPFCELKTSFQSVPALPMGPRRRFKHVLWDTKMSKKIENNLLRTFFVCFGKKNVWKKMIGFLKM